MYKYFLAYNIFSLTARLNSALGWCGEPEAFTYVTVDLGAIHRVKAIVVKVRLASDSDCADLSPHLTDIWSEMLSELNTQLMTHSY